MVDSVPRKHVTCKYWMEGVASLDRGDGVCRWEQQGKEMEVGQEDKVRMKDTKNGGVKKESFKKEKRHDKVMR